MKISNKWQSHLIVGLLILLGWVSEGCVANDIEAACFKVKLGQYYCGRPNTVLVLFEGSNKFSTKRETNEGYPERHVAAITDFPNSLYEYDTTIYVRVRYDPEREKQYWKDYPICDHSFGPAKILIFDALTSESCKPLKNK